jgi:hypothetical protein
MMNQNISANKFYYYHFGFNIFKTNYRLNPNKHIITASQIVFYKYAGVDYYLSTIYLFSFDRVTVIKRDTD